MDDISLEEVARRAGVSVQTVIRRFGGKQGLLAAAAERETQRVRRQRDQAPVGDLPGAVRNLVDHYEELGAAVLRLLAQEDRSPALRTLASQMPAMRARGFDAARSTTTSRRSPRMTGAPTARGRRWPARSGSSPDRIRGQLGLAPVDGADELFGRAPLLLYMTAEPFEYPRSDRPNDVVLIGPCAWDRPPTRRHG